jgi:hypothetical protein
VIGRILMAAAVAMIAAGCAMPIGKPAPSLEVLETLRAGSLPPMQVGRFAADPSLKSGDGGFAIRAATVASPVNGSWASYLGETVKANLAAAGKLDAASTLTLEGFLTDSDVSSGLPDGKAVLGARFSLSKAGKVVFDRRVVVEDRWQSSFIGVEAIPDATNHYVQLFGRLTRNLFADPAFQAAAAKP